MEETIGLPPSPQPLPDDYAVCEPAVLSDTVAKLVREEGSDAWKVECERCLQDVWKIGRARLGAMGLE